MSEDLRAKSRRGWVSDDNSIQNINAGTMLRIADATEKMAMRHTELMNARDMYQRWYEREQADLTFVKRQLAAAKGQITKLRKRLAGQVPSGGRHE